MKKNTQWSCLSVCIMVLLPWLAVQFVPAKSGMLVSMLLFFAVNPLYSVAVGVFAGRNFRAGWFQPLLCSVLFLLGARWILQTGQRVFCWYALGYTALGYAAAFAAKLSGK